MDNQPENKKRKLPRLIILIPAVLALTLAYAFYSNSNSNSQLTSQQNFPGNQREPEKVSGLSMDSNENEPIFIESLNSDLNNQLISLQTELQKLQEQFHEISLDNDNFSLSTITDSLQVEDTLTLNDTAKTNSLIPQDDDEYDLGSEDNGFNNAYIHQLWGSSILTIGDHNTSHNLTNNNDLLISGNLEVDGPAYFDDGINAGGQIIANLADPLNPQDAVTKAYYEANTPTGVFSRTGATITPTTAGDAINFTNNLITFDSLQTFGGSTLTNLGYLSSASSDIQIQLTGLDTDKQDSLTLGNITGTYINVSGGTGAVVGSGVSISLPQSIATTATPIFAGATISTGGIDVTGGINVTGAGTFNNNLDVLGNMAIIGDTTTSGGMDIGGMLTIDEDIEIGQGVPMTTQDTSIILANTNSPTNVAATAQSGGSLSLASATGTDISFSSTNKTITSANWIFGIIKNVIGYTITVSGSASNNGTYTVTNATASVLTVAESIINENAGASITVTANTTITYYSVVAFNSDNMYSAPSAPTVCKRTAANKQCSVSWSAVVGVEEYGVYNGSTSVMNGKDNSSSNNTTTMIDSTRNFTAFTDGEGLALVRDWIINVTDEQTCEITSISTNSIVCSGGGMDWDSGDVYSIVRAKRKSLVAMSASSPYVHSTSSSGTSVPHAGMSLYTPNNICIGYKCTSDYVDDAYAKLSIYATHQDTQGASLLIRSGLPQENLSNWLHRSGIVAQSEDSGGGTGSMAAGVFLSERNGEVDQMSWNTGLFGSYNQRAGTFIPLSYPASGVRASSGSRGSETVNMSSGMGVAGLVGYVQNDNALSTINKAYAFYAGNGSNSGTITDKFGMYIASQTGGVNNYGLWLDGSGSGSGIYFGSDKGSYIVPQFNANIGMVIQPMSGASFDLSLKGAPGNNVIGIKGNITSIATDVSADINLGGGGDNKAVKIGITNLDTTYSYLRFDTLNSDMAGEPTASHCDSDDDVGRSIISDRWSATSEYRLWTCLKVGASAYDWAYVVYTLTP